MIALLKLVLLASLGMVTLGIFPDRLRGSILAIAMCVVGAAILHYAAP